MGLHERQRAAQGGDGHCAALTNEGLQAIATRVSEGSECTIIIEDGRAVGAENAPARKAWKAGEF